MKRILLTTIVSTFALFASVQARIGDYAFPAPASEALKAATEITLLSLEPHPENVKEGFHGYKVLGETALTGDPRKKAEEALRAAHQKWDKNVMRCFTPRHGLRVKQGAATYDFVICFECNSVRVYEGEKLLAPFGITAKPDELNALLTAAKVPLPKQAEGRDAVEKK